MESIDNTPAKRRKIINGDISQTKAFDSDNDSGDSLFEDYETVETVPLQRKASQQSSFVTQPTQKILDRPLRKDEEQMNSIVQVAGSSPIAPRTISPSTARPHAGGVLAGIMAPPGTAFRLPQGVSNAPLTQRKTVPHEIQEISSDEDELSKFRQHSSDEDTQTARRADIKPSSFTSSSTASATSHASDRFKSTLANSLYKPATTQPGAKPAGSIYSGSIYDSRNRNESMTNSKFTAAAPSSDVMANAYGTSKSRRPPTAVRQHGPAKAMAVQDMRLDEVPDLGLRLKIERIRNVLPNCSVRLCWGAIIQKKGNFEDALDLLSSQDDQPPEIDLTGSDDEESREKVPDARSIPPQRKSTAKQQLKAPIQKIHEKWTSTQNFPRPSQASPPKSTEESSKPRRRLVQGRKKASSPASSPPRTISRPRSPTPIPIDSEASDSGLGSELQDTGLESRVLSHLNTCSAEDLADTCAIGIDMSRILLSQRPFESLQAARKVEEPEKAARGKRKSVRRLIGDKVVDKCLDMFAGYDAVDKLVENCEQLGQPIRDEMNKWSKTPSESSTDGEIELAALDDVTSGDSGIGTPSSRDASADEDVEGERSLASKKRRLSPQPNIMAPGVVLKDYQVIGINWLALLFKNGLSGILADDMGLGKTCQVISFFALLMEKHHVKGPHVVIVPASTLENWLREFQTFCPQLSVMPYYAGQNERAEIREQIAEHRDSINVIVTTYTIAKAKRDNMFFREVVKPVCTVFDEGHILKNSKSAGYEAYMKIPSQFRLLLTGTPLQNNLGELASLLGFILPSVFRQHSEELDAIFSHKAKTTDDAGSHAALLSAERIQRAKRMLTPFVLRRKKHQVLKHLPKKNRRVEYCELLESQTKIYDSEKARALRVIAARQAGEKTGNETSNVMMALRKASLHPLLFRRLYNDETLAKMSTACLQEREFRESNPDLVFEDMSVMTDMELHRFCERYPDSMSPFRLKKDEWMDSGKVRALIDLLQGYKANGDRVLVFSQFVMVLDILEAVLETVSIAYFRLDGSTRIEDRQAMLDQFHKEAHITVFLLSTGAGGAGINLACANRVVIFDSSFNPQQDIQAENRAHRVGQTREVDVVRLVTRGTIEEQIHALGETKLILGDRVAAVDGEESGAVAEKRGEKMVADMMMNEGTTRANNGQPSEDEKKTGEAARANDQSQPGEDGKKTEEVAQAIEQPGEDKKKREEKMTDVE